MSPEALERLARLDTPTWKSFIRHTWHAFKRGEDFLPSWEDWVTMRGLVNARREVLRCQRLKPSPRPSPQERRNTYMRKYMKTYRRKKKHDHTP